MNEQIELNNLGEPINLSNYTDEKINSILEDYEKTRDIIYKYAEKMGNCEVVCLGGDYMIYEQKPIECGTIVKSFIDSLD